MALRFRKSIKIMPGVRLNLSKSGVSTTLGGRGASVNVGKRGVYANAGLPGTGLSMRQRLDTPKAKARKSATPPPAPDAWIDETPAPRSPQDLARLGGGAPEQVDEPAPERRGLAAFLLCRKGRRGRGSFAGALGVAAVLIGLGIAMTPSSASVPASGTTMGNGPLVLLLSAMAITAFACWQRIRDIGLPGFLGAAAVVGLAIFLPMGLLAVLAGLLFWPGQAKAVTPGIRPGLKSEPRGALSGPTRAGVRSLTR